jgi:hypothetical protein
MVQKKNYTVYIDDSHVARRRWSPKSGGVRQKNLLQGVELGCVSMGATPIYTGSNGTDALIPRHFTRESNKCREDEPL